MTLKLRKTLRCAKLLLLLLVAPACLGIGLFDPETGQLVADLCTNEDSDPDRAVSFATDISPMFGVEGCGCHFPTSNNPIGFDLSGLSLASLADLRSGGNNSESDIILVGQPCESVLWQKLSAGPPFGGRMPQGGPFLTAAELQQVADWIVEGALDN